MYTLPTVPTPILHIVHMLNTIRDRPFNLKGGGLCFLFRSEIFFSDNTKVRIIFFQNLTLDYMTKTLCPVICTIQRIKQLST